MSKQTYTTVDGIQCQEYSKMWFNDQVLRITWAMLNDPEFEHYDYEQHMDDIIDALHFAYTVKLHHERLQKGEEHG